ncbi:MAG: DUF1775 domain-containing protein [Egibacteraceae bacterium]
MRTHVVAAVVTGAVLVALAGPAWAHAELTVSSVPAGTVQSLQMHVPEERQGDRTDKVQIQVPAGFVEITCEQKAGWSCTVDTSAAQPIVAFTRVDLSIQADELYPFSVRTPAGPGTFTLPTVQSYASGTVRQWIGAEGSDEPAPVLVTTGGGAVVPAAEAEEEHHDRDQSEIPVAGVETEAGGAATSGTGVTAALLGIGCAALLGVLVAMSRRRRRG